MSPESVFVIVGASLAGVSAAEELRKQGFDSRILLVGSETHPPYLRPPLSKDLLTGKAEVDSVWVQPEKWYETSRVELRTGVTVTEIRPDAHTVVLDSGETIHYDKLLLATGSRPRTLNLPGFEHPDVRSLRTLDDALALKEAFAAGDQRLVVAGSGWIGMEVAASARQLGNEVTLLDRNAIALSGALGDEIGARFAQVHRDHGVRIFNSVQVDDIALEGGHVQGVHFAGGQLAPADVVVVGVGAVPNIELAQRAGLDVDNGVLTDELLRSSAADIFAAGDIANSWHPTRRQRIRSEHWSNAIHSGQAAGRSMLGQVVAYDRIPYFYTDQFEIGMEYSGYSSTGTDTQIIYRGDVDALEFIAFWVNNGRVIAGMNVNIWDVNDQIRALIGRDQQVDLDLLAREDVALDDLAT